MQLTLTGHHVDITDSLRNYATEKMQRLARHFDQVLDANVILSVEKLRQKAEAELHVSGAKLFAEAIEEDMYAALDKLVDKLDRQVLKYKEKHQNHHRNHNEGSHRNLAVGEME